MTGGIQLDYQRLAELHRPSDTQAIGQEIRRLHSTGLTAQDISVALRINLAQVLEIVGEPPADTTPPQTMQLTSST